MTLTNDPATGLAVLHKPIRLDLNVNDLRILIGCFRAVAYFMRLDNEPYLDPDALELQKRLEQKYEDLLSRAENSSTS